MYPFEFSGFAVMPGLPSPSSSTMSVDLNQSLPVQPVVGQSFGHVSRVHRVAARLGKPDQAHRGARILAGADAEPRLHTRDVESAGDLRPRRVRDLDLDLGVGRGRHVRRSGPDVIQQEVGERRAARLARAGERGRAREFREKPDAHASGAGLRREGRGPLDVERDLGRQRLHVHRRASAIGARFLYERRVRRASAAGARGPAAGTRAPAARTRSSHRWYPSSRHWYPSWCPSSHRWHPSSRCRSPTRRRRRRATTLLLDELQRTAPPTRHASARPWDTNNRR